MRRTATTARAVHGRRRTTPAGGTYSPHPADTASVEIPPEISALTERLARNTHENWASQRIELGWRHGPVRDDERKEHPCLVPYDELPEDEKDFDRRTALETVRLILALGYRIVRP